MVQRLLGPNLSAQPPLGSGCYMVENKSYNKLVINNIKCLLP